MNLVLCGFMACGKTTLGRLLSERLGMPFVDTDEWIAEREGRSISLVFGDCGEPYFRALERSAVAYAAALPGAVVATGGGVPLDPDNLWRLESTGIVFYVSVSPEVIWTRLSGDGTRPIAAGFRSVSDVASKLAQRAPHYAAIARRVEANERPASDVADEIWSRFRAEIPRE